MKLFITTLFFSASVFTAYAQSELQKAEMQFDMRDYSLAISSYEQALLSDPDNQKIPASIASSYVQLQDYLKASQWYEKIIDEEDVKPEHLLAYGDVLKSLRLYAKAKFYYQKLGQYDQKLAAYLVYSCDVARIEMNGDPYYEINVLNVNSRSSEFAPFLFHDDLLFSSLRTDIAVEQTRKSKNGRTTLSSANSVFVSQKLGTKDVTHFKNTAQGEEIISHVKYSEDGKWVAFQKSDFREGQRLFDDRPGKQSLYLAKVSSDGQWTDVKAFQYNGNAFSTGYPSFSPDGSVLYFASTRPGGFGGWDIYVSFRSLNGWTAPANVGNVINTSGNEISPFYSDHKLFFSSDRQPGIGGFDIFKASSQEGLWTNVRSMGYPLNSPKDDIDFVWDPVQKMGYFSSNRIGTTGAYDIYSSTPLYEEVIMTVMDQESKNAISGATITYRGAKAAPLETDQNGQVIIHQRFDETSSIVISHEDYKDLDMNLKAPGEGPARYDVYIDKSLATEKSDLVSLDNKAPDQNSADIPTSPVPTKKTAKVEKSEPAAMTKVVVVGTPSVSSETLSTSDDATTQLTSTPVNKSKTRISQAKPRTSSATVSESRVASTDMQNFTAGMYAVQIAAVGKSASLARYSSLSTIGKVMQYHEKGLYKIRVGYYDNEAQAKNALRSIKTSGYPDAFIVKANPNDSNPVVTASNDLVADASNKDYIVRLGTYSRPEFFDASKVQHLGTVDTYKSGKFTIMLLRGFNTYQAADDARIASTTQGFKDAYIVIEKDGGLHKVTN
jgi:WD40 repeat protein/sporulation related protein/tetratricopeptide repeat protein